MLSYDIERYMYLFFEGSGGGTCSSSFMVAEAVINRDYDSAILKHSNVEVFLLSWQRRWS